MKKYKLGINSLTRTELGVINSAPDGTQLEHTVEMSETNFRMLIAILPKTDTHNALNNELLNIKDLCTTLSMKHDLKRQDIIDMLSSGISNEQFMQDLTEFRKTSPDIKIVGKIGLSKYKDNDEMP